MILLVVVVMALYYASTEDLDIVPCFFILQVVGDPPRVTRNPVKESLVNDMLPNLSRRMHKPVNLNHPQYPSCCVHEYDNSERVIVS